MLGSEPAERKKRVKAGGRQKGTPNKTTVEIRELARKYGPDALQFHVSVLQDDKVDKTIRQRSADAILDRAYGKPTHVIGGDEENPLKLLMDHLDGKTRGLPSEQDN